MALSPVHVIIHLVTVRTRRGAGIEELLYPLTVSIAHQNITQPSDDGTLRSPDFSFVVSLILSQKIQRLMATIICCLFVCLFY